MLRHPAPPADDRRVGSKTPKHYWDESWREQAHYPAFRHWSSDLLIRELDQFLSGDCRYRFGEGSTILEVGCGNSSWLPYFAQRWKLSVEGIDYSEEGCRLAREILSRYNLPGTIHLGNLFSPPEGLIGKFDFVISAGVVEHFEEQKECLSSIRAFMKPTGRMITIVPNLCGWMGDITHWLTPDIYAVHVPTSREKLKTAHEDAGMKVLYCDYFLPVHLGVLNLSRIRPTWVRVPMGHVSNLFSKALNVVLSNFRHRAHSRRLSPYVLCVAENTAERAPFREKRKGSCIFPRGTPGSRRR